MKKLTLLKILMCSLLVIVSTHIAVYFYFYKRDLESTAVAATYMVALDAMRELSFIQEGIENKNIKQGCFIHGRIDEILSDIESCFNKNYHQCASYGMSVVPTHYFESYMQISKNPTAVSGCSE